MANKVDKIAPTAIDLHQKSRLLEIRFSDGKTFKLPCEYLRVFSPAAEVKVARLPVYGKASVNISNIEPQGNYALRLFFDDGHDTGVYSWETLYRLGEDYAGNWNDYLLRLSKHGLQRNLPTAPGERSVRILYFMQLVNIAGQEFEALTLPASVLTVTDLLAWLRERGQAWADSLADERVQVTVNKQFSEPTTPIGEGDELAIVPRAQA